MTPRPHGCHYFGYVFIAVGVHATFLLGEKDIRTYGWILLYTLVSLIIYAGFHRGWGLMIDAGAAVDRSIDSRDEQGRLARLAQLWFGPSMQAVTLMVGAVVAWFALRYGVKPAADRERPLAAFAILVVAGAMGITAIAFFAGFIALSYRVTHSEYLRMRAFAPEDTPAIRELVRANRFVTGIALVGFLVFSFPLVWVFARTPIGAESSRLLALVIATFLLTLAGMFAIAVLPNIWFFDAVHRERWKRLDGHRIDTDMHGRPTGEEASRRLAEYLAASERAGARGGTFAIVAGVASVLVAIVPYLIAVIARA